jgi:hypothetical protein
VILLVGVFLGLLCGLVRAMVEKRPYTLPAINRVGLAMLAFLPQALVFFIPQTGRFVSHQWAALILPLSLGILVIFVWYNRNVQGFWLLGIGLLLNLAVIATNGGLMPISAETLTTIHGARAQEVVDSRAFGTKNVVLPVEETRLEWLADRFTVPDPLPIQFAFSLGDVFLAIGAFWTLWASGAQPPQSANHLLARQPFSS